ncbi:hypothetical protein CGRA01v4_01074 [Colletotrichum graminicola]|nr:hypothetical protein CGRA01v4_01074 [Colletotrichum graminicola]
MEVSDEMVSVRGELSVPRFATDVVIRQEDEVEEEEGGGGGDDGGCRGQRRDRGRGRLRTSTLHRQ